MPHAHIDRKRAAAFVGPVALCWLAILVLGLGWQTAPASAAGAKSLPRIGIMDDSLFVHGWGPPGIDPWQLARPLKPRWIRFDMRPRTQWQVAYAVRAAKARGLLVQVTLTDYTSATRQLPTMVRLVRGFVDAYSVWNEPELDTLPPGKAGSFERIRW